MPVVIRRIWTGHHTNHGRQRGIPPSTQHTAACTPAQASKARSQFLGHCSAVAHNLPLIKFFFFSDRVQTCPRNPVDFITPSVGLSRTSTVLD